MRKGAALAIALLLVFGGCAQVQQRNGTAEKIAFKLQLTDANGLSSSQKIEAGSGTPLFDAMQESGVQMKYEEYSFGKMMTAVGALAPGQGEYLAIYVDGKYAEKGVEGISPADGSIVEFRVEKIR